MDPNQTIKKAVKQAQETLARHIAPGDIDPNGRPEQRDCRQTINELLDTLDDTDVLQAVNEIDRRDREAEADEAVAPARR